MRKLIFFTNIPTPYQLDFFKELSVFFDLTVVFYAKSESNRHWDLDLKQEEIGYTVHILTDNKIAKIIQKWVVDFHFSLQIIFLLNKLKADYSIVSSSYWSVNSIYALFWSKINCRKVAYFSEPLYARKNILFRTLKWFILRILNMTCDYIFCIGKSAIKSFEEYNLTAKKFNIPYNININPSINQNKIVELNEKYDSENSLILLTSGSLIERKGIDIVIKSFLQVNTTKSIKLLILGDGIEREALKEIAGEDNRISFIGFVEPSEIINFFAIADIFVFASRYDGWAVVIMEAISCNLPIISSDKVGASIDLLTNYENGLICESENIDEFTKAMEIMINDDNLRHKIKSNSNLLKRKISSSHIAEKVSEIFN